MKKVYLALAIVGFIAPNIPVLMECIERGDFFYFFNVSETFHAMFGNSISTALIIDLFFAAAIYLIWTYFEARRLNIKNVWRIWVLTLLFGMGGSFCLFLYWREKKMELAKAT